MSTRFLLVSTLAVVGFAIGCHHDQPDALQKSRAAMNGKPATQPSSLAKSATAEEPVIIESPSTADSVAQKARAYASQMEKLMNEAPAKTAASRQPATQPAAAQSAVKWAEPQADSGKVSPQEREVHSQPVEIGSSRIHEETGPVSNTGLAIGSPVGSVPKTHLENERPQVATAVNPPKAIAEPLNKPAVAPDSSADEIASRLTQHVKDYPQDLSGQLDYQLLRFSRGDSVPDVQALTGLASEDRELMAALLDGLSNFRGALRADNNMLLSRKIKPLMDVADRLRTQAELTVPVVALCTKVDNYGKYEPIQPLRFKAGIENEVIVYCEVENFSSQLDGQKQWETALREDIVLYSDTGIQVWTPDKVAPRASVDRSRTRRHDFFLGRKIRLPANLSIGGYILKVSVIDQQVNRVAENTIAVEIVAQ